MAARLKAIWYRRHRTVRRQRRCGLPVHNHDIDNAYTDSVIYTDTLKPGMYVAIMPMLINDRIQQYIILDEIVRIDGHG